MFWTSKVLPGGIVYHIIDFASDPDLAILDDYRIRRNNKVLHDMLAVMDALLMLLGIMFISFAAVIDRYFQEQRKLEKDS
jgi:hypothetical protein